MSNAKAKTQKLKVHVGLTSSILKSPYIKRAGKFPALFMYGCTNRLYLFLIVQS